MKINGVSKRGQSNFVFKFNKLNNSDPLKSTVWGGMSAGILQRLDCS
jgi:hypothetical protein